MPFESIRGKADPSPALRGVREAKFAPTHVGGYGEKGTARQEPRPTASESEVARGIAKLSYFEQTGRSEPDYPGKQ
ncbi:hypothetical protein SBV1_690022 [Verrucomicrobia bacterium]|nr:hypothetical protein SBV1_690022 [Verrucomicrobiota bacterium]